MNYDLQKINNRIKELKTELSLQWQMKKKNRDQGLIESTRKRLAVTKGWRDELKGKKSPEVPVKHTKRPSLKPNVPLSLGQFKEMYNKHLVPEGGELPVIVIETRDQIDENWDFLKTANVSVKTTDELRTYYIGKIKEDAGKLTVNMTPLKKRPKSVARAAKRHPQ